MDCPNCKSENPAGKKFCSKCGVPLALICQQCGSTNSPEARFCGDCGARFGDGTSTNLTSDPSRIATELTAMAAPQRQGPGASEEPAGERKTVTALFADIKGSMSLMERLDPEEARALVDPVLRIMIDAVRRFEGYIVQSTGDGVFALFGAPVACEDHAQRALLAGLRMHEEIKRYSARLSHTELGPLEVRVGVNSGETVLRTLVTGEGQIEYTPIGHAPSLAARMQTIAASGSIAVTEETRRLCEGYFQFKSLGPTPIKGASEPVPVYEVIGLGALRTRLQASARRGLSQFVGREAEIEILCRALDLARQGHGQIVAAVGEPGVGKSRLIHEFKTLAQGATLILEGVSAARSKTSPYAPVIDLLHSYFEISGDDEPGRRREKVASKVLMLDRSLEDSLPMVLALLGIQETPGAFAQMDARIRRRRTLDAIKHLLLRESVNQPLVVIFEDLHWIDDESQALLDLLAEGIGNARVLMVVTYRSEYRHQWGTRTSYTQVRLDPLEGAGAQGMLAQLVGADDSTRQLRDFIIERTQGNPFFMEETVQALFDNGTLVRNGAAKLTKRLDQLRIPPTVQALLSSRIDRLPAAEKELLQTLAVTGKEFSRELISRVSGKSDDELDRILADLELGEFICEELPAYDSRYAFKHALTHEVAYNSVLSEKRKLLHARAAEAIESLYAGYLDDHVDQLAYHYSHSGNIVKTLEFLRRAGEQAAARSAHRESMSRLNEALQLVGTLAPGPDRDMHEMAIRVAMVGPMSLVGFGASAEFMANLERARALCEQTGSVRALTRTMEGLQMGHWLRAEFPQALQLGSDIVALGERTHDRNLLFSGRARIGIALAWKGEYRAARQILEQAFSAFGDHPSDFRGVRAVLLFNALHHLSWATWMLGYPDQALAVEDRFGNPAGLPLDPFARATIGQHRMALRVDFLRDHRLAREQAEALLALSREHGFPYYQACALVRLGRIAVAEGKPSEGIETMLEGMRTFREAGEDVTYNYFTGLLAEAYLAVLRGSEGLTVIDEVIARSAQCGQRFCEAEYHRLRGELLLLTGVPQNEAELSLRKAITIARGQEAKSWELRAATSLGRLLKRQGKTAQARGVIAPVYGWFREDFDTTDLKEAKALIEELAE